MAYAIEFSPTAQRQLRQLHQTNQKRVLRRIGRLEKQPRPRSAKKLQGSKEPLFRIREGDYRIVYTIEDERLIVLVIRIGHRSEVYR
jgi:mRNA interferase RelE/StbE